MAALEKGGLGVDDWEDCLAIKAAIAPGPSRESNVTDGLADAAGAGGTGEGATGNCEGC